MVKRDDYETGWLCTGEIRVLQIVSRVQTTAGEDSVLDAGGQEVPETHPQIEVIELLQQAVFCVIGEVLQMIPVDPSTARLACSMSAQPISGSSVGPYSRSSANPTAA